MKYSGAVGVLLLVVTIGISACSNEKSDDPSSGAGASASDVSGLSKEAQIGPITELSLGEIDPEILARGETVFSQYCTACHQKEVRVVGPALGGVLERRTPVFVMNMILNPDRMLAEHPDAKALLTEYGVPMVNLGISETDARAILEYLR
jgi:mono/diheme cytochrome c family protein